MTRLTTLDLPHFHRATIGFDRLFDELERGFANSPNGNGYPPYNIAQINDDEYMISLGLAEKRLFPQAQKHHFSYVYYDVRMVISFQPGLKHENCLTRYTL